MQELGKFNLKITLYGIENYMSFTVNNKLIFIDSFNLQVLIRELSENFKQRWFEVFESRNDNNKLDLVKQKVFYLYENMNYFQKLKEELPSKEKLYSFLTDRKNSYKEYEHIVNISEKFEKKMTKSCI